jgi:tRNA/tmRNA/rRNA uracil-C5-methylase (TrmA/RlmC/RlmD family)
MNYAIEGIYKNGSIELIETPEFHRQVKVMVIFLENKRKITKLGGLFKNFTVDYDKIEQDLKELKRNSSAHILDEFDNI